MNLTIVKIISDHWVSVYQNLRLCFYKKKLAQLFEYINNQQKEKWLKSIILCGI